ncbi:MAG: dihydrodipicolinate synthase family protein [Thaumarchaeota archaeon]|nr:dihydrodipicolinate synthase family protein [Nitrososphaerota archaeon]
MLGEGDRLSDLERTLVLNTILEATNQRVPLIAGTGASGTHTAIIRSKEAEKLGVDAVMIAPPHLLKPNDDAIVEYYSQIAKSIHIPIIIQDEPLTYDVHFSPDLIRKTLHNRRNRSNKN